MAHTSGNKRMSSNKKAIMEIHRLSARYSQNLIWYRDFFGSFNEIQRAQYKIINRLGQAKKITDIDSILNHTEYEMNKLAIRNIDLLKKDNGYFRLRLVQLLFILITFPISLPTLMFLSRITRGTFNFLKTDGSILIEQISALCQLSNNQKTHQTKQSTHNTTSNITKWINNMHSIVEFHHRFSTQQIKKAPHDEHHAPMRLRKSKQRTLKQEARLSQPATIIHSQHHDPKTASNEHETYAEMAINFFYSAPSSIAACTYGLFSTKKKSVFASRTSLDEAILNCELQDERQIADLEIITEALTKFQQEQSFYNQKILKEQDSIKQSVVNNPHLQKIINVPVLVEPINKWECMELLNQYCELMDSYPKFLDTDAVTLERIQSYHEASLAHHDKVLALAERLLPELSCMLNQSRLNNIQDNTNRQLRIK